ncbi:hypothetical protein [Actinomadura latina]|uniref:Uncharacterized protein n=1 Tax=Actinomadura latina TaxID=163603 RepID=A0A846YY15_9ACTN|nr:hypothetical protein [Actinomadura latina]NKZ03505.1 hypothetical protein [Actinomadura latina]
MRRPPARFHPQLAQSGQRGRELHAAEPRPRTPNPRVRLRRLTSDGDQGLVSEWPGQFAALNRESTDALNAFIDRRPGLDRERLVFATVDVPYGAVRRHLVGRRPPPPSVDLLITTTCRAVLTGFKR